MMHSKSLIVLFLYLIPISGFSQHSNWLLQGENGEHLNYKFIDDDSRDPFNFVVFPTYVDSSGNNYSGIATQRVNNSFNKVFLDSICINNGRMYSYAKRYNLSNMETPISISYTNEYTYNSQHSGKIKIEANYDIQNNKISSITLTILKKGLSFYCRIQFVKENVIKQKTVIQRNNDEIALKNPIYTKYKGKFKEREDLKKYFNLFPEIISQEIIDTCIRLGALDASQVIIPVIYGNCNYQKK